MSESANTLFGLLPEDMQKLRRVFASHPHIEQGVLYGSRAQGQHSPGSDIDITLVGDVTWQELQQIEQELDDLLLPYQIDLSLKQHMQNPDLLAHIERVGRCLYP